MGSTGTAVRKARLKGNEFAPADYVKVEPARPGDEADVRSGFGRPGDRATWTGSPSARLLGREVSELRAALFQHMLIRSLRTQCSVNRQKPLDPALLYRLNHNTKRRWERKLDGRSAVGVEDVGFVAGIGPRALPKPKAVHQLVKEAVDGLAQELAQERAAAQPGPDGLLARQRGDVVNALRGWSLVELTPPAGPGDDAALDRAEPHLDRAVFTAVERLRDRVGCGDRPGQPDVAYTLLTGPAGVDGGMAAGDEYAQAIAEDGDAEDIELRLQLPPDWADRVAGRGFALVNGWLLLDVHGTDEAGRPVRATVLSAAADRLGRRPETPDERPVAGWRAWPVFADIGWPDGQPQVRPDAAPYL